MSFITDFYNSMSGVVTIWVPSYKNHNAKPSQYNNAIQGILQDDPQIQMGNTFTPLSELDNALQPLQNFQQVMGANNVVNYLPASASTWQGTSPIKVHLNFYMLTLYNGSNIMGQLKKLAELAALHVTDETSTRFHGGYRFQLYKDKQLISNNGIEKTQNVPGTCRIDINENTYIQGMLLQSLQYQPSTVVCRNKEPLYYIVNAQFIGYRAPVTGDLKSIFGEGVKY